MVVNFTQNYTYHGGNLLVGFYLTSTGNYKSASFYGQSVSDASVQGYSYSSLSDITATQRNFIPKTTFAYTITVDMDAELAGEIESGSATMCQSESYTIQSVNEGEAVNYRWKNGNTVIAGETGANAARIRVVGSGVPSDTFLDLYFEDEGVWMTAAGLNVAELDEATSSLQWQAAALDVYAVEGNSFILEIGQLDPVDDHFVALAAAQSSFSDLQSDGHVSTGGITTQVQTPWSPPTFHAIATSVPEPSTGLLALFGAVLMFRRRR